MKKTLLVAMLGTVILLSSCGQEADTTNTDTSSSSSTTSTSATTTSTSTTATTSNFSETSATTTITTFAIPTASKPTTTTTTTKVKPTTTTTTKKIVTTRTTATTVDLDLMYKVDLDELNDAYDVYKHEIEMEFVELRVNCTMSRQDLEAEIAKLQGECLAESIQYQRELSNLQKKQLEAEMMGATNSYYKTLAEQYKNQINSLNSKWSQTEGNYGKKINNLKKQIQALPTDKEISAAEKAEYENLDAWYQEELKKLNNLYGK